MTTEPQADIVERLERFHEHHGIGGTLIIEAATEITRLRAQLAEAELRGVKAGLEAGARVADTWTACDYSEECNVMADSIARELRAIDPTTLLKDADHG